ncbi:MAG: ElyC/SanA/YdcF family protein [Arcobacteraceae bacterium]|jgi:uncharacterized SAM-binding protein YcdF (DUF218 family)|nr:YdcF family protein [Arcobacteraceae bacterium]MDY0365214.1 ElyC/SanA/YdcF family protein [Arcobacteraceae bacterium]
MFLLKKIISAFLLPIPIGIFILIVGLAFLYLKSYKKAKIFIVIGIIWFVLLSNELISNFLIEPLENYHSSLLMTPADVEYVMVLGSGHRTNELLPITSQVHPVSINRLVEGIRHYQQLKNIKFIVSGYAFDDPNSQAQMQKRLAIALGVDEKDIITLDTTKDTQQEAQEAKKIVKDKKLIVVTSADHMMRAMMLFKKEGLNAIASPTGHSVYYGWSSLYDFSAKNLRKSESAFHEYLGIVYSFIRGEI